MARVMAPMRVREGVGTKMRLSEVAIFIAIVAVLLLAGRWYFFVYRTSPGVALDSFLSGMRAGNVAQQYALLDEQDKQFYSSQKDYDSKAPIAHGYTERISNIDMAPAVPDAKDPNTVTISATLTLRAGSQGSSPESLLKTGDSQQATDTYTLHKDKDGNWKVVLSRSDLKNLLKITPNAAGSNF